MITDRARIEKIFTEAVGIAQPDDRDAYLRRECAENTKLRERVEALLAAHEVAGSFLELPPEGATAPFQNLTERPGSTVGRYKLLEQIGEGGFGVVFMAEQEQPVRRRVALKVIKLGMDTKQVVVRFEAERQALAMMDHPNIAKVLDAGATETGRPYFVMELVRGVPITEYCDQAKLTTHQRLVLFQSVCSAVQHAHQKGIIHRDLKPSNVLVTLHDDKAVPKVIDFGVAKATQARLTERTLFTEFRQMIGTPAYMSPEQAHMSGLDVDTRSDVYSLGVLLYELLTGSTPIDTKQFASASYDDVRRMICEVEPPSPSARLSTLTNEALTTLAIKRHCEPGQLAVSLRSDLDWIVMKCLEKDRTRRYDSASALAQDLKRYLDGQPIEARPPSRWYRLGKFVRRNKGSVLACSAIVAALSIGVAIASVGYVEARRQTQLARTQAARSEEVSRFLRDMLAAAGPSAARGRDTTLLRELLDHTANRVATDLEMQPVVQADLWHTLGTTYGNLGENAIAVVMLQRAVESNRKGAGDQTAQFALELAELGHWQSKSGDFSVGKANAAQGLEIARRCGDQHILAMGLDFYSRTLNQGLPSDESIPYLREAIAIERELGEYPLYLSGLMGDLGVHLIRPEDWEEAESLLRHSLAVDREHDSSNLPAIVGDLHCLAQRLQQHHQLEEAEEFAQEAFDLAITTYPPDNMIPQRVVGGLTTILMQRDKWEQAEAVCQQLVAFAPSNPYSWSHSANVHALQGDQRAAVDSFSRAVELAPDNMDMQYQLAVALFDSGQIEEYREQCHRFLTIATDTKRFSTETAQFIVANKAATTSLILPVDGADFEHACRLADVAGTCTEPKWVVIWLQLGKALGEYRCERFESAVEWTGRSLASESASPPVKAAALGIQACCLVGQRHFHS